MQNDLTIVIDAPGLLVLRRNRLPQVAQYLFGATLLCVGSMGINGSLADNGVAERAFGLLLVGASAGTVLFNLWRLMFALWTTTTFRVGADRIEARIGGPLNGRTLWLNPREVHASQDAGEVIFRNDESTGPLPYCDIFLVGSPIDRPQRLYIGRVKPDRGIYLAFRISEVLAEMRADPSAPPAP